MDTGVWLIERPRGESLLGPILELSQDEPIRIPVAVARNLPNVWTKHVPVLHETRLEYVHDASKVCDAKPLLSRRARQWRTLRSDRIYRFDYILVCVAHGGLGSYNRKRRATLHARELGPGSERRHGGREQRGNTKGVEKWHRLARQMHLAQLIHPSLSSGYSPDSATSTAASISRCSNAAVRSRCSSSLSTFVTRAFTAVTLWVLGFALTSKSSEA